LVTPFVPLLLHSYMLVPSASSFTPRPLARALPPAHPWALPHPCLVVLGVAHGCVSATLAFSGGAAWWPRLRVLHLAPCPPLLCPLSACLLHLIRGKSAAHVWQVIALEQLVQVDHLNVLALFLPTHACPIQPLTLAPCSGLAAQRMYLAGCLSGCGPCKARCGCSSQ
jgi:hypothetical protein